MTMNQLPANVLIGVCMVTLRAGRVVHLGSVLCIAFLASSCLVAHAQGTTWQGATNGSWSVSANWNNGVPASSGTAVIGSSGSSVNLGANAAVGTLQLTTGSTRIAGTTQSVNASGTLTINNGLIHTANSNASYMRTSFVLGNDQTWTLNGTSGTGSTAASGFTLLGATTRLTFDLNGKTWTKDGPGQVSIGGYNFTAGSMDIKNGSLRFTNGAGPLGTSVIGSGSVTVRSGAAIILAPGVTGTATQQLEFTKSIVMEGGASQAAASNLSYGGASNSTQVITAPIQWNGVSVADYIGSNSSGNRLFEFAGNWSGTGTVIFTNSIATPLAELTTRLSGNNSGLTGLVENLQTSSTTRIQFTGSNAGSSSAEWRLSGNTARYELAGNSISLGALSGTSGTLGNYSNTTDVVATIGGKGVDSEFSSAIIDGGSAKLGVVKTGAGTLTLNGTSSYTGGTTVSAGRLRGTTLGIQGAITNNAAVELSQSTTGTYAGIMVGSGSFTKSGAGSVTLSGSNTFSGLTDVQEGTLAYGVANALGSGNVQVSGGTLNIATFTDSVGTVTLTGGSIVGTTGVLSGTAYDVRNGSISAILNGTGAGLTKSTSGTVTLSGVSTYSGQTRVSAGVLALGVSGAISNQSNLLVDGGGFNLAGFNDTVGTVTITSGSIFGSGTLSGSSYDIQGGAVTAILGGSGGLTKSTSGTTVLSGINAYTGVTAVNAGTLAVNGSIAASSGVGVSSGATLGGSGAVSIISGEGLVSPGNSPGILTATSIDPSTGMDFAFELTGTGSPTYGNASNSVNDVLRLTAATPALSALNTNNVVSVYFGGSIAEGDTFRGGTYVDSATTLGARDAFATAIAGADWQYYVYGNGGGTHAFNGTSYYTLGEYNSSLTITRTVVADSANFSGGTVNGAVTQFVVVPEPGALAIALTGIGGFMAWAARQRSRRVA
jgi:fibronectin-binding autotransporter adhesin